MMLNVEQGAYYSLDPIGAQIWELLEQPASVREIVERLQQRYAVSLAVATVDHFTDFAVHSRFGLGGPPPLHRLPTVDEAGVDRLTGAATYRYPLEVPPCNNGMQPE